MSANQELKMRVARDVIAQLDLGYVPKSGVYLHFRPTSVPRRAEDLFCDDRCLACALGTMFIARMAQLKVDVGDLVKAVYSDDDRQDMMYMSKERANITRGLSDAFDPEELAAIETAFECSTTFVVNWGQNYLKRHHIFQFGYFAKPGIAALAELWLKTYWDPADRLRAIMENVIRNGEFRLDEVEAPAPVVDPAPTLARVELRGQEAPPVAPRTATPRTA